MAPSCRGITTGLGHAHGADQCEGQTASFTGGPGAVDSSERKEGKRSSSKAKQLILGAAAAGLLMASSFAVHVGSSNYLPRPKTTNINLAVASNFYGVPPSNSAITDIINAFMMANPSYTVTVVDNGATATLK